MLNKNFLKPSKQKIIISLLILLVTILLVLLPFPLFLFPLYPVSIIVYTFPHFILVIAFLAYFFGCYIGESKKRLKGLVLYTVVLIIVSFFGIYGINVYNESVGRLCDQDYDCRFSCGNGAVNERFIFLDGPFVAIDKSCNIGSAKCENNKCQFFSPDQAESPEECARFYENYLRNKCYLMFAKKLNDKNLCGNIDDEYFQDECLKKFEKQEDKNIENQIDISDLKTYR